MSVVAAKLSDNMIVMAADSQVTHGWTANKENKTVKLFKSERGVIVGAVGDAEPATLMKMYMRTHIPKEPTVDGITEFIHEFRGWLKDHADSVKDENTYLIAYQGHLFYANGFYIYEVTNFSAIGSGMEYALAALHLGHTAQGAVEVACQLNIYCAPPVNVLTMERAG